LDINVILDGYVSYLVDPTLKLRSSSIYSLHDTTSTIMLQKKNM